MTINANFLQQNKLPYLSTLLVALSLLSACAKHIRSPVPPQKIYNVTVLNHHNFRYWSHKRNTSYIDDLILSMKQEHKTNSYHRPVNILAISGGGHNGAFGAGLLSSWSKTGKRPIFKMVTGISTGAVIAPFAFLGSNYDKVLKSIYTEHSEKDVYRISLFRSLAVGAIYDTTPYQNLIAKLITKSLLKAIAAEHNKGRRLYIGTTHLDADQLTVWNMGAIANSNSPDALKLFRQIIIASSAIPPAFPPVLLKVKLGKKKYDEMHIDGGVKAQLFLIATALDLVSLRKKLINKLQHKRKIRIYAIRNGILNPEPEATKRSPISIAKRALSSLIKAQALNDIKRIYTLAHQQGAEFYWVAIPNHYKPISSKEFDQVEMKRLFNLGYQIGLHKQAWSTAHPY